MSRIAGLRTLVVEDNALLLMMVEDMLRGMGCTVAGTAADTVEALRLASALELDFAILDLNLDGQLSYAVADVLMARGVPFVFATGYTPTSLPPRFANAAVIAKPFMVEELQRAMERLIAS